MIRQEKGECTLKPQQEKPKYTTWQNTMYMLKKMWGWSKKDILISLLHIPPSILSPLILVVLSKILVDCLTGGVTPVQLITTVGIAILLYGACCWLDKFIGGRLWRIGPKARHKYQIMALRKMMDTDYENIEGVEGKIRQKRAENLTNSENDGGRMLLQTVLDFGVNILGIFTYVAILSTLNIWLVLFLLAVSAGSFFLLRWMNQNEYRSKKETAPLNQKLSYLIRTSRNFTAGKDIRLYHISHWFQDLFCKNVGEYLGLQRKLMRQNTTADTLIGLLMLLRDGVAYAVLIVQVLNGRISPADFVFYFGLVTGFSGWTMGLAGQMNTLHRYSLQCNDYRAFLELPDRMRRTDGVPLPGMEELPCSVDFNNVFFSYAGSETPTLENLSFHVRPGEKIALVGLNGAGKTTCMKLLCGLYQPTAGEVRVNGRKSTDFNRDDYFSLFTAVFQDVNFLPVTIAQNVALCREEKVDYERVARCIEAADLTQRMESLPHGVRTMMDKQIHEEAADFSGGERQRLLLARALYKDAPVIVLDEPTAALDPIAENRLYLKYSELTKGRTSFYISHRLSSTRFCDRILFLENGRIAEEGTHDALMERRGKYYAMYEMQSQYYKENPAENETVNF